MRLKTHRQKGASRIYEVAYLNSLAEGIARRSDRIRAIAGINTAIRFLSFLFVRISIKDMIKSHVKAPMLNKNP